MSKQFLKNITATVDEIKKSDQTPPPHADLNEVVDNLLTQQPAVQPHVIEHFENLEKQTVSEFSDATDRFGVKFDPMMHITGRDGKPTLTKLGKLMRKPGFKSDQKPVRSTSQNSETKQAPKSFIGTEGAAPTEPAQAQLTPEHKATGVVLAGAIMAFCTAIGGEEFLPTKRDDLGLDERAYLENASAEWLRAKNMVDLPPDMAFGTAIALYIIPRFTMPKTQSRIKLFFTWLGSKWVGWRAKKSLNGLNNATPKTR